MMFCSFHDPALALFLAETPGEPDDAHVAEWYVLYAGVVLAFVLLTRLLA